MPSRKHVLFLPFPAFGHILPLFELANRILPTVNVTFALSSTIRRQLLDRKLVYKIQPSIRMIGIEDGFLPPESSNTNSAVPLVDMFSKIMPGIEAFLPTILHGDSSDDLLRIDGVIIDEFIAQAARLCFERNVPVYHFMTGSARSMTYSLRIDESLPSTPNDAPKEILREYDPSLPLQPVAQIIKDVYLKTNATFPHIQGIIFNSVRALEADTAGEIKSHPVTSDLPTFFVGPLSIQHYENREDIAKVVQFLDAHKANEVIYVAFGSIAAIGRSQIEDIAAVLLKLKRPFIWQLSSEQQLFLDVKSFGQTGLFLSWAPQTMILSHRATGLFVSHCGWNSCMESLEGGVPILGWPIFGDQLINAKFMERLGVGRMIGLKEKLRDRNWLARLREYAAEAEKWKKTFASKAEKRDFRDLGFVLDSLPVR